MDLNNPDVRQDLIRSRLAQTGRLVAAELAAEFDISLDTVRRDLIRLEEDGAARRVRGGAVPAAVPAAPLAERVGSAAADRIAEAALPLIAGASTLALDGGTTVLALARRLPPHPGRLVVTPSPHVAVACQSRGVEVMLLGGHLSLRGGIAVGEPCEAALQALAVEVTVLGACGLDPDFGLSSDDLLESRVKQALCFSAQRTLVLADATKLGRRARHRTLPLRALAGLVTDATAEAAAPLSSSGLDITHA